jgi:hypothetical protein
MNKAETTLPKLLLLGVAAASLAIGVSGAASASTDTTEPTGTEPAHTEAEHTMDTTARPEALAVDGSAEPTSPEAQAFCEAELALAAAFGAEDEAAMGAAAEALAAAADPVGMAETVGAALAAEPGSPEFEEPFAAVIDYMKANCGFAEVDVVASEYTFEGVPRELPAGPAIISLENAGEQVHEFAVNRINDDVTLTVEELLALPEEESATMATPVAFAFAFPGTVAFATADLTPGRYVALCFLPEGATPEVLMQLEELGLEGPEDTLPAGNTLPEGLELGPPHFTKGMVLEFTVA